MSTASSSTPILAWEELLRAFSAVAPLADRLSWPVESAVRQEAVQQLLMTVAQAYAVLLSRDPHYPQLITFTNPIVNSATNPDFMYFYTALDAAGTYVLSGDRGTSLFIHVVQNSGIIGLDSKPGPPLATLDVDTLRLDGGRFEVCVSAQRPPQWQGDWWRLDPGTTSLSIRQASYDWANETDGRFAIESLDGRAPPDRMSVAALTQRLGEVPRFAERYLSTLHSLVSALHAQPCNVLSLRTWAQFGGLTNQHYYQGHYELHSDEALIIETEIPSRVRYWGIALHDELFNSIEWVNHQSSLNGFQASTSADGRVRAVLALQDPGVPNWLDPAGRCRGIIQGRWFESSDGPTPQIRRIPLKDVRLHLPADTRVVSAEQRNAQLRLRRRGAQYRRKW